MVEMREKPQNVFFLYVDFTNEVNPRPFYVGKGNVGRTKHFRRNQFHSNISKKYGCTRQILFASKDEKFVFNFETEFIATLKTRCDLEGHWGANMTDGGEGSSGHITSEVTKQKLSIALKNREFTDDHLKNLSKSAKQRPDSWSEKASTWNAQRWEKWRSQQNLDPRFQMIEQFALDVKCCTKTVKNWIRCGMPSFKDGNARYIDVEKAKTWLDENANSKRHRRIK